VLVNCVVAEHYTFGVHIYTLLSAVRNYNNKELIMQEYGIKYEPYYIFSIPSIGFCCSQPSTFLRDARPGYKYACIQLFKPL
jgi:hypothetical protein